MRVCSAIHDYMLCNDQYGTPAPYLSSVKFEIRCVLCMCVYMHISHTTAKLTQRCARISSTLFNINGQLSNRIKISFYGLACGECISLWVCVCTFCVTAERKNEFNGRFSTYQKRRRKTKHMRVYITTYT